MGILYSHLVFQPPEPPTYTDDSGSITFRRFPFDQVDSDDDDDFHATDISNAGSVAPFNFVHHPIFYINTSKGQRIPAAYFHQPKSYYTILFSHGNGEDLGVTAPYAVELSQSLKTSVLCYDYTGYGLATGKPSESNCYSDIRAAYTYLVSNMRIPPKRILLFGRSLGSGPTVHLAASLKANLGGVVLIAPLTSCVRVVFNSVPSTPRFDMFPNIDKIHDILVPVFCVHGMVDNVVPFNHALQLTRRARYPLEPLWIRDASHNNLESSRFQYQVFLRYMTVLQQFRRWQPPAEHQDSPYHLPPVYTRRYSTSALGKVAKRFEARERHFDHRNAFHHDKPVGVGHTTRKFSVARAATYFGIPAARIKSRKSPANRNEMAAKWPTPIDYDEIFNSPSAVVSAQGVVEAGTRRGRRSRRPRNRNEDFVS